MKAEIAVSLCSAASYLSHLAAIVVAMAGIAYLLVDVRMAAYLLATSIVLAVCTVLLEALTSHYENQP